MEEIWKDIVGYEGLYQVSNLGRVQSLPRVNLCVNRKYVRKGKVLKGMSDKDGYLYVLLSKEGVQRKFTIQRKLQNSLCTMLICLQFCPSFDTCTIPNVIHAITPFKIFQSVIIDYFVSMIHLWEILRIWYKMFGNKSMY